MAHTCGLCGLHGYHYFAVDEEGRKVKVPVPKSYASNHNYSHRGKSWKACTKVEKQYMRHSRRVERNVI